jgi:hypothetical protein
MNYSFGNINHVATIDFDFEIGARKLKRKLEKLNWPDKSNFGRSEMNQDQLADTHLIEILQLVKSEDFKIAVLEHLYSLDHNMSIYGQGTQSLQWLWNGQSAQTMNSLLSYDAYYVRDEPGYTTHLHIDRIGHPFVGVIYLNETNSDFETDFYDSNQKTNHFSVPHKYSQGWLQANHVNTWHEGKNRSRTEMRYSIIFNWGFAPK